MEWMGDIPNGWTWLQANSEGFWITNMQDTVSFNLTAPDYVTTVELDGVEYEVYSERDSLALKSYVDSKVEELLNQSLSAITSQISALQARITELENS